MHNESPTHVLGSFDAAPAGRHPCLDHVVTLSFGEGAKDNRPSTRTLTFGALIQESAARQHARKVAGC